MTDNEIKIIESIRNRPNPEQLFLLIMEIIYKHLEPSELLELPSLAYLRELFEAR